MRPAFESSVELDGKIQEIKDQFSISLQYYYELNNEVKGESHLDQCISLVHSLKSTPGVNLNQIKDRLLNEVHSIHHTGHFSIRLV